MSSTDRLATADLAAWIRSRRSSVTRFVFGLAGPPGCGKSTVAASLALELDAPIAPMDGYHLPNAVLDGRGLRSKKGAPDTFDVEAFVAMLDALRRPGDVWLPDFDRTVDEPRPGRVHIPADAPIVIVEGNYLLLPQAPWNMVAERLDAIGYIDIDQDTRVRRLIDRHVEFGRSPADAAAFVQGSDEHNAALVLATRDRADVVISHS